MIQGRLCHQAKLDGNPDTRDEDRQSVFVDKIPIKRTSASYFNRYKANGIGSALNKIFCCLVDLDNNGK